MNGPRTRFATPWLRLMSCIYEPANEQSCWFWARRVDAWGYAIVNLYVPGLKRKVTLKAHILAWAWLEGREWIGDADALFLAYLEIVKSGCHLDHTCMCRGCIRPDHLDFVTPQINQQQRAQRQKARAQHALHL